MINTPRIKKIALRVVVVIAALVVGLALAVAFHKAASENVNTEETGQVQAEWALDGNGEGAEKSASDAKASIEEGAEGGSADSETDATDAANTNATDAVNTDATDVTSSDTENSDAANTNATDATDVASSDTENTTQEEADPVFGTGTRDDNLVNTQQKPDSSFLYDSSIEELQTADTYLNDQTVQVVGEVVGDRILAEFDPGYCWIVLQSTESDYSEIPVFMTTEASSPIDTYGAYGKKGTSLQVRGEFHLACSEHEGLTDVHADTVTVVEKGSVKKEPFKAMQFMPGFILVMVGLMMLAIFHIMRERER